MVCMPFKPSFTGEESGQGKEGVSAWHITYPVHLPCTPFWQTGAVGHRISRLEHIWRFTGLREVVELFQRLQYLSSILLWHCSFIKEAVYKKASWNAMYIEKAPSIFGRKQTQKL